MTMPPAGGPPPWSPGFGPVTSDSSNRRRWIVLGVSVMAVVVLVAGLLVWRATSTGDGPAAGGPTPVADDGIDRTVGLLREKDPVCDEWRRYSDELAAKEERWASSNRGIPAAKWTPEQREIFVSVGEAMSVAADQFESILPKARNIVLQELIAQTIVYLRAYVEKIPNYVDSDALIAGVAGNFSNAVTYMCSAVPLVPAEGFDNLQSSVIRPVDSSSLIDSKDPICGEFVALSDRQNSALIGWTATDSTIPAVQWTPTQRALFNAVRVTLEDDLVQFRTMADKARGRIMGDLLATQNAYMQAFADAIPTYTPDDAQLWTVVASLGGGMAAACEAEL